MALTERQKVLVHDLADVCARSYMSNPPENRPRLRDAAAEMWRSEGLYPAGDEWTEFVARMAELTGVKP